MNLLQNVESGMGCPDWHTAIHSLRLQRLLWIFCPGHAGVSGNKQADRLASTADITSGLQLGRAEVLRGLRNFLNMDRPEHHSTDHLKERGVEKGSGRHSTLQRRERSVFSQTSIGTAMHCHLHWGDWNFHLTNEKKKKKALFRGQPWGDCWVMGRSAYGPFWVLRCHLELKLRTETPNSMWY